MNSCKTTAAARGMNRRQFLKRSAAVGGAVAVPWIVPASALGRDGTVAPSERIVLGGIGIGRRGSHDLRWVIGEPDVQFVASCDVWRERREAVKKTVDEKYGNSDCVLFRDMREFLEKRTDIDALLITTGDRWHATASVMAMRAGKDVYSEKPSSMTVAEGQAVVETAQRYGRVYQTGTQRLSEPNFVVCNELARLGRLGQVQTVRAHISGGNAVMNRAWLPAQPEPVIDDLDWNTWLGPCPWRPFNEAYIKGGWHGQYDFHTGCIGEWGAHTFAQCQVAIGCGDTSAAHYAYVDNASGDGMTATFANGVKMVMQQRGWHGSCGVRYEGTEGWVACADGYSRPEASNPALLADYAKIVQDYAARTGRALNHMRNFLDCVKSRQPTVANPTVMHRSMSTVHAANIAMWLRRDMTYDPVKEAFVNDPEADRLRSRAMREPWGV